MIRGLIVGKFYPPHKGHQYLIETALANCDQLIIMVCHKLDQTIPGELRAAWLRELYPQAEVRVISDMYEDDDSEAWAIYTIGLLGYRPDVVFTSEDYGHGWAHYLGCRHYLVDQARSHVPCSATLVRRNPLAAWQFLPEQVRGYFAKRVCILGAESTGTTTMAQALAKKYRTNWVPEYGREYSAAKLAGKSQRWNAADFMLIALEQNRRENAAARRANKLLICDTDSFATTVWGWRYLDRYLPGVEDVAALCRPALYLLTAPDIPFVQDGTRDGEHIRYSMHKEFIRRLHATNRPFILLEGTHKERLATATKAIDAIIA